MKHLILLLILAVSTPAFAEPDRSPAAGAPVEAVEAAASRRLAVYTHDFDPPLKAQIDSALHAREELQFGKILLLPTLTKSHKEEGATLVQRLEMLRASVKGDDRFIVPTMQEVQALVRVHGLDNKRVWTELTKAYQARTNAESDKVFFIVDPESPGSIREIPDSALRNIEKRYVLFQPKDAGSIVPEAFHGNSAYKIHVPRDAFGAHDFRKDPLLNDILLTHDTAKYVLGRGLYETGDMLAGFHALPPHLVSQLQYEQLLNDRIENLNDFASIKQNTLPFKYYPESRPVFRLWNVDVPEEKVRVLATGNVPKDIVYVVKDGKRYVRFFIHPKSRELFREALAEFEWRQDYLATPTSSHRSLIAWDPKNPAKAFGVKSTLDAVIGESHRVLSTSQIERASATSAMLQTMDKEKLAAEGILFIDEPVGVVLKGKEMGYAVRELVAPPSASHEFIPVFSLYSTPPDGVPPIQAMLEKSGLSPREFAEKFVIEPMVRQFSYLSYSEGLIGEPHEQNLLMELKDGLPTGRFYYRDLAGFHINPEIRAAAGKSMDFLPPGIARESLKLERANPIANAITYLHKSNFYALHHALSTKFPDITKEWVEETFEKHMSIAIARHTNTDPPARIFWRKAVSNFADTACPALYKNMP